jgi:hypothetical protein
MSGPLGLAARLAAVALPVLLIAACGDPAPDGDAAGAIAAEDAPLSAVTEEGPVKATVQLSPRDSRLGDTLALTLTVEAEPEVTVEMPAFGEALGRFSILDFTPRERTEPDGRTVLSQRYTLQAAMSGTQRIPPLRIEFLDERGGPAVADDGNDFRELLTDELAVKIVSVLPEGEVTDELRPARPALPERAGNTRRWLVVVALLLALAGGVVLVRFLRSRALERARITAYDRAMGRIAALEQRGLPVAGDADAWYVELSDIVRRYLEDRYGVRAPELTTEEFLQEARLSAELTQAHRELLSAFLEQCDQVKFAAYHPETSESQEALATSRRFLDETRILPEASGQAARPAA